VPSCFIAMPVSTSREHSQLYRDDAHFEHVLMHLMVPAVERAGYKAIKPLAVGADLIHAEIIRHLETTDLVLCDISTLNPNVFFELGIRTAVDKPVCIVKDSFTDRIPFDTSILNVHTYDPSLAPWLLENQINLLAEHLTASAQRSDNRNTLWRYFGLTTRAAFKEGESSLEEKVDLVLLQLQGLGVQWEEEPIAPEPIAPEPIAVVLRRDVGEKVERGIILDPENEIDDEAWREFVEKAKKMVPSIEEFVELDGGRVWVSYRYNSLSAQERYRINQLGKQYGVQVPAHTI
jgi:hypothetical protein